MTTRTASPARRTEAEKLCETTADWGGQYVDRLGRTISNGVRITREVWVPHAQEGVRWPQKQWDEYMGETFVVDTYAMRNGKGYGASTSPTRYFTLKEAEAHVARYLKQSEKAAQKRHGK